MKESTLENRLRDQIKKLGGLAIKIYCLSFTGLPDRLIIIPGGIIEFVEMKKPGAEVKKGSRQELVHKQLRKMGCRVTVINSREGLDEYLTYAHQVSC